MVKKAQKVVKSQVKKAVKRVKKASKPVKKVKTMKNVVKKQSKPKTAVKPKKKAVKAKPKPQKNVVKPKKKGVKTQKKAASKGSKPKKAAKTAAKPKKASKAAPKEEKPEFKPVVVIYSAVWCHFCNSTKAFFKEHEIEYKNVDVDQVPGAREEMIAKSGERGVPQVYITDEKGVTHFVYGFDEYKLRQLLKIDDATFAKSYG